MELSPSTTLKPPIMLSEKIETGTLLYFLLIGPYLVTVFVLRGGKDLGRIVFDQIHKHLHTN